MSNKSKNDEESGGILDTPTVVPVARGNKRSSCFWEASGEQSGTSDYMSNVADAPYKKLRGDLKNRIR